MRKTLFLVASVAFAVASSGPVMANDREDCFSNDADRIIRGCTEVINGRPDLSQRLILAVVYHRRGTAYASKKEYDQAIADYTQAIDIDPKYVGAYNDRGIAYTNKGDYKNAIADVTRAVELTPAKPSRPLKIAATLPPTKRAKSAPSASTKASRVAKATAPIPVKALKPTPTPSEFNGIPSWASPMLKNGVE